MSSQTINHRDIENTADAQRTSRRGYCRLSSLIAPAILLFLIAVGNVGNAGNAYGQNKTSDNNSQGTADTQQCTEPASQTAGSHSFRREGESFEIPINMADCQPVALELRWSNGGNNGSNFNVVFLDSNDRPIFTRQLNGFLSGYVEFPLMMEFQPSLGSLSMVSVPSIITIQAARPFAYPSSLSYRVIWAARRSRAKPVVQTVSTSLRSEPSGKSLDREPETVNREGTQNLKTEFAESADRAEGKARGKQ